MVRANRQNAERKPNFTLSMLVMCDEYLFYSASVSEVCWPAEVVQVLQVIIRIKTYFKFVNK